MRVAHSVCVPGPIARLGSLPIERRRLGNAAVRERQAEPGAARPEFIRCRGDLRRPLRSLPRRPWRGRWLRRKFVQAFAEQLDQRKDTPDERWRTVLEDQQGPPAHAGLSKRDQRRPALAAREPSADVRRRSSRGRCGSRGKVIPSSLTAIPPHKKRKPRSAARFSLALAAVLGLIGSESSANYFTCASACDTSLMSGTTGMS